MTMIRMVPSVDPMVSVPDLQYPQPNDPSFMDRLGATFARYPIPAPTPSAYNSPLATALLGLVSGASRGIGANYVRKQFNSPSTYGNRLSLARLNLRNRQMSDQQQQANEKDRLQMASEAARTLRQHQQDQKAAQKEAEQTPGTPEYQDRIDRESQYQADLGRAITGRFTEAGLPVPARYRHPVPPKGPKPAKPSPTPMESATKRVQTEAASDSIRASQGMSGPYGRRRQGIIKAMGAAPDTTALQNIVMSLPASDPLSNDDAVVEGYYKARNRLGHPAPNRGR